MLRRYGVKTALVVALLGSLVAAIPGTMAQEDEKSTIKSALGALSAAYLYQSQISIGVIADAQAKGVYDEKQARDVLQVTINLLGAVEKQLHGLRDSDELDEVDQKYINEVDNIVDLLKKQASELKEYWESEEDEHLKKYLETRKGIQKKLDRLFNQNKKEEE